MNKQEIQAIAKKRLSDLQKCRGSILFSSLDTLKPGCVYLLGFNPGGSNGVLLSKSIDSMLSNTNTSNAYIDENWSNKKSNYDKGKAPLQRRVCWLLEELRLNPAEVCASNLIFVQSRDASGIDYQLADKCWPVHEAILDLVKPHLILTFGNARVSPYQYLLRKFGGEEEQSSSGHGTWCLKKFECQIMGRPTKVAGLPHLSRYNPIERKEVIDWLSELKKKT